MNSTAITNPQTRTARGKASARDMVFAIALSVVAFVHPVDRLALADDSLDDADRAVPEFNLELLDGGNVDTSALQGKPWVVNFWATWCAPCIEEIPSMNTAWESLAPAGVGMLAINVGEPADAIESFMEKIPIDFPVALGDGARTLPNWEVKGLPTTLVIDRDGMILHVALGPREWDDAALIERLAAMADQ